MNASITMRVVVVYAFAILAALMTCGGADVGVARGKPANILFLAPIGSKSHKQFYSAVVKTIVKEGHKVTFLTPFKSPENLPNVREVVNLEGDVTARMPNVFNDSLFVVSQHIFGMAPNLCTRTLETTDRNGLMKETFDLAILSVFLSDCFLSLVHDLQVPFAYVSPADVLGPFLALMGNPSFPSISSNPIFGLSPPLTFLQRALSALGETASNMAYFGVAHGGMEKACRDSGVCRPDMPPLSRISRNASLLFANSIKLLNEPRPIIPNIAQIGGLHCRPASPLPQDLEQWVAGAGEHGYIFFSLGSAVKPKEMPESARQVLIRVLGSLKQRVLWKWNEDSMPDLPKNVRLGKWLPQQDILGDPRLRLFITHGGQLSTQEATYHATPVLGLPVFGDQHGNMLHVVQQGWGRVLQWGELTEETLSEAIQDVITNQKMREVIEKRGALMRDTMINPEVEVTFWVNYLIKHKGAPHLRSLTLDMAWYEVYNTDVWLTLLTVSAALALLIAYVVWKIIRRCCCPSKSDKLKTN